MRQRRTLVDVSHANTDVKEDKARDGHDESKESDCEVGAPKNLRPSRLGLDVDLSTKNKVSGMVQEES